MGYHTEMETRGADASDLFRIRICRSLSAYKDKLQTLKLKVTIVLTSIRQLVGPFCAKALETEPGTRTCLTIAECMDSFNALPASYLLYQVITLAGL